MEDKVYIKDKGPGKGFETFNYTVQQSLTHINDSIDDIKKRLGVVELWKEESYKSLAVLETNLTNLINQTEKMNDKIDVLLDKPAKRFDTMINTAITVIVSGVVGALMSVILLKP